ncbi:plastocyanin/azurin family copper-binding protein [Agrococcus sp. ProA11]|uniref:plastocyanin/azurin family copper-binding protein n=1 Tax=Agrococcus chionoecetis TaxID=3153752 RepID=UPI003260A818
MNHTRPALATAALVAAFLLAGCSGGTADDAAPAADSAPAESSETGAASETDAAEMPADGAPTTLMAVVGSEDDPEAYTMSIVDEDGQMVTSVPAGDYSLTFVDRSQLHNFHLMGDGVDVATDVQGTDETTVEITLAEGSYEYVCDPHASTMNGVLEVTG